MWRYTGVTLFPSYALREERGGIGGGDATCRFRRNGEIKCLCVFLLLLVPSLRPWNVTCRSEVHWAPSWSQLHLFGHEICHIIINILKNQALLISEWAFEFLKAFSVFICSQICGLATLFILSFIAAVVMWSSYLTDMIYIVFGVLFLDNREAGTYSCFYKGHDDMNCSDNSAKLLF